MARYWTDLASECYERHCNCNGCYYDTYFESDQKCQMWRTVFLLTRNPVFNRDDWLSTDPFDVDEIRTTVDLCNRDNNPLLNYITANNMNIFKTADIPTSLWTEHKTRKLLKKLLSDGVVKKTSVRKRTYYKLCQIST
jgi:hypothetical protein